jgi:hypothetical protein
MTQADHRARRTPAEQGAAGAAAARVEVSDAELARAQGAYRGSLQSSRAWRAFSSNPRHHDVTYWTMLVSLFVEPGMNRTVLIDRIIEYAGVSRSTAERAIHEARQSGYIVDRREGREVRHFLSDRIFNHCVEFFRSYMDLEKIVEKLGYDKK